MQQRWLICLGLSACGTDRELAVDAAGADAAVDGPPSVSDAPPDAMDPTASWARYTIAVGAHSATVAPGPAGNPRAGLISGVGMRAFDLALDPSAIYVLANPTQPEDQLDWNKLPGVSDCGTVDLSADGMMFGWRWRIDTVPQVLELTAYANNAGTHLTPPAPLALLDADDLASGTPLHYELAIDGGEYRFSITGEIRGRTIAATATLPRRCATTAPGSLFIQWAAGLYFGGTSTAPSPITARIFEP